MGLDPDSKKAVGKYSLGMRQRLGLAQALMEDPQLLILDELCDTVCEMDGGVLTVIREA